MYFLVSKLQASQTKFVAKIQTYTYQRSNNEVTLKGANSLTTTTLSKIIFMKNLPSPCWSRVVADNLLLLPANSPVEPDK